MSVGLRHPLDDKKKEKKGSTPLEPDADSTDNSKAITCVRCPPKERFMGVRLVEVQHSGGGDEDEGNRRHVAGRAGVGDILVVLLLSGRRLART